MFLVRQDARLGLLAGRYDHHESHLSYLLSVSPPVLPLLFWQTPERVDFAKSCKHLFVLFVNCCSFCEAERLDDVSMVAVHYDKRKHAAALPAADVFIGNTWGVVHHVWVVHGD